MEEPRDSRTVSWPYKAKSPDTAYNYESKLSYAAAKFLNLHTFLSNENIKMHL